MTKKSLVFPGQGVQAIGMGKELYDTFTSAKEVFQEIDEALGQNLSHLMFHGDGAELTLTSNAQPAIMAVSMAALRVLERDGNVNISQKFSCSAGHSLGEYSALCASGVFDIAQTAKLLKIRGESMQSAVPNGVGSMVALLGGSIEGAQELAEKSAQDQVCVVANDNSAEQTVLSGHAQAIERACGMIAEFGFKRAIKLDVSAPFHSPLMNPAAVEMRKALEETQVQSPQIPVIHNFTADYAADNRVVDLLVDQICGRVRWRETVLKMADLEIEQMIEIGQGKVLCGLAKRIAPQITSFSLQTPQDFENLIKII